MDTILITGAAGFIGLHLAQRLLQTGYESERPVRVIGYDNLNDYYSVALKEARLALLCPHKGFVFERGHLEDNETLRAVFQKYRPQIVINLAAQAGVRFSITHPDQFVQSNMVGFLNVLEACRHFPVQHLIYASSSSVYGLNTKMPFSPHDNVAHPISLYAASKRSNELMAHAYSHGFGIPTTGLRFFTVYGPYGRPDMALFKFTKNILEGKPIEVYNHGKMRRNFTYVDDTVEGVFCVLKHPPKANPNWISSERPDPANSSAPYRIYNVGSHDPVELMRFIELIERETGRTAQKKYMPLQTGDVLTTFADISDLVRDTGYTPRVPIEVGVARFVAWYREFYRA